MKLESKSAVVNLHEETPEPKGNFLNPIVWDFRTTTPYLVAAIQNGVAKGNKKRIMPLRLLLLWDG